MTRDWWRKSACAALVAAMVACAPAQPSVSARPTPSVTPARASTSPTATAAATASVDEMMVTIQMAEHFYSPSQLKVKVGATVVWWNVGTQPHDVNSFDGLFRSANLDPGNRFSFTFLRPGVYGYFCIPHAGDGMIGEVIVE